MTKTKKLFTEDILDIGFWNLELICNLEFVFWNLNLFRKR